MTYTAFSWSFKTTPDNLTSSGKLISSMSSTTLVKRVFWNFAPFRRYNSWNPHFLPHRTIKRPHMKMDTNRLRLDPSRASRWNGCKIKVKTGDLYWWVLTGFNPHKCCTLQMFTQNIWINLCSTLWNISTQKGMPMNKYRWPFFIHQKCAVIRKREKNRFNRKMIQVNIWTRTYTADRKEIHSLAKLALKNHTNMVRFK